MTEENYTGVTTGTVATACSLAAIDAILDSPDIVCVTVETPKKSLDILIDSCSKLSDTSACAVAHKNPYNEILKMKKLLLLVEKVLAKSPNPAFKSLLASMQLIQVHVK